MPTNYNESPPSPAIPLVDEGIPGLGRRSGLLEQQRQSSGGLSDECPENPVQDSNPIRVTREK